MPTFILLIFIVEFTFLYPDVWKSNSAWLEMHQKTLFFWNPYILPDLPVLQTCSSQQRWERSEVTHSLAPSLTKYVFISGCSLMVYMVWTYDNLHVCMCRIEVASGPDVADGRLVEYIILYYNIIYTVRRNTTKLRPSCQDMMSAVNVSANIDMSKFNISFAH